MDKNLEDLSRRKFVKGAAATGVAATGITAVSGGAAAQQNLFEIDDVTIVDASGGLVDVDVTLDNIDLTVDALNNIRVSAHEVLQTVDVDALTGGTTVTVRLNDIQVANANQLLVTAQALSSGGAVLDTDRQIVEL